jgi:Ca2+/H+ antiporter, TMEM165/GDT1 family
MKKLWIKKGLMILIFGSIAILVFGFVVMSLWNNILPAVIGVKTITFLQALGILVLSKILFGGFSGRGGRWRGSQAWKEKMKQRWDKMTPEEREKFKNECKSRWGGRWGGFDKTDSQTMTAE